MRKANYPKEGFYSFRSKTNPDELPFVVFLAEGLKIEDCYDEITEEEYIAIVEERDKRRKEDQMQVISEEDRKEMLNNGRKNRKQSR